jgi:hypothetical protein
MERRYEEALCLLLQQHEQQTYCPLHLGSPCRRRVNFFFISKFYTPCLKIGLLRLDLAGQGSHGEYGDGLREKARDGSSAIHGVSAGVWKPHAFQNAPKGGRRVNFVRELGTRTQTSH